MLSYYLDSRGNRLYGFPHLCQVCQRPCDHEAPWGWLDAHGEQRVHLACHAGCPDGLCGVEPLISPDARRTKPCCT